MSSSKTKPKQAALTSFFSASSSKARPKEKANSGIDLSTPRDESDLSPQVREFLINFTEVSWRNLLHDQFSKPYFKELVSKVTEEQKKYTVYPPPEYIFNAFNCCSFQDVKVVILGQDPYHGPKQAHGLSFSVLNPTPPPPSLRNIFKELAGDNDLSIPFKVPVPASGDLTPWAKQGVLLLNATLTVRESKAASHSKFGWRKLTDTAISRLNKHTEHLVFILWGRHAQAKAKMIDGNRHLILKSSHPSPLSAHAGFFGNHQFSKANEYLRLRGRDPINWNLDAAIEEKKRKGVKRKRSNSDDTADPVGDSNSSDNEAEGEVDRKRCR